MLFPHIIDFSRGPSRFPNTTTMPKRTLTRETRSRMTKSEIDGQARKSSPSHGQPKIFPRLGRSGRFARLSSGLQNCGSDGRQLTNISSYSVCRQRNRDRGSRSLVEPRGTPGHMARHPMELNLRLLLPTIWKIRIFDSVTDRLHQAQHVPSSC